MKLAQNEKILKEVCYATSKQGVLSRSATEHWIVITNKRVIGLTKNKNAQLVGTNTASSSQEFAIEGMKGVKSCLSIKSNFWPILQIIVSIPLCFGLIGIPLLIKGVKKLNQYSLSLEFLYDGYISSALRIKTQRVFIRKKANLDIAIFDMQLSSAKINKDAVTEIVNEIGAVIIDNQQEKEIN